MLRGMSIRHFQEWRAYMDLEPFDEVRADYRAAQIVQAVYSASVNRRKGQAIKLQDCLLRFGPATAEPRSEKDVEQARADIRGVMNLLCLLYNSPAEKPKSRVRRER